MKPIDIKVSDYRQPEHPIESLLVNRWSSRAMSGEVLRVDDLNRLFEAARWAPSSYNAQPWFLVYVLRDAPAWAALFDTMVEFNQSWAKSAGALIAIVAKRVNSEGVPTRTHSFDCGAAWQNLALQGSALNLVVHAMQGFDYSRAERVLAVAQPYAIEALIAVGYPGDIDSMSELLQEREKPSPRKRIGEFVCEGRFMCEQI